MYATTKELKNKVLKINTQNMQQIIGILVIFILEKKPKKENVLGKYDYFSADICVYFEPLLGREYA